MYESVFNDGYTLGVIGDFNSLINGDLFAPEWKNNSSVAPNVSPYNTSDGTFLSLAQLNINSGAGTPGALWQAFGTPTGVTSVQFSISASEANSKSMRLNIYASDGVTSKGSLVCALTPSMQSFSYTVTGLTPGLLYFAAIEVNYAAQQAQPICGKPKITPIGGSGVFAGNFIRIRAGAELMSGTYNQTFYYGSAYPWTSPNSEFSIITDAARVAVGIATIGANSNTAWLISGVPYQQIGGLGSASGWAYSDIAIPFQPALGPRNKTLITARQDQGAAGGSAYTVALYVPTPVSYLTIVKPTRSARQCLIYGDSITGGNSATNILLQGWPSLFKARFPGQVILEQYSGRAFYTDTNNGTAANEATFVKQLAKSNATDVIFAIGVNDYFQANWTAVNFGASLGRVADALHTALPNADIWFISPIPRSVETANALGDTLGAFRTQIQTVASAGSRASWAHFIDGTGASFPGLTDLVDGTHPNTEGHAKYARSVLITMGL